MIKQIRTTARTIFVSATLGLAGLSAAADAAYIPPPTKSCEWFVQNWCAANWFYFYYPPDGYQMCVYYETLARCPNYGEQEYVRPTLQ